MDVSTSVTGKSQYSRLLAYVETYDWPMALHRLATHPHEARILGPRGRTALHVACEYDAPAVLVQALMGAYPDAALMVGTSDMTPLHAAVSSQRASVDVVRVLLEGTPSQSAETMAKDSDGDTPLHTACRYGAPLEVLSLLLQREPFAVHERDNDDLTPLLRLWVRSYVILGDEIIADVKGHGDVVDEMEEVWAKTCLLLNVAHFDSAVVPSGFRFRAVHAAAAIDCPRAVLRIATALYPEQIQERDEHGRFPLVVAAMAPVYKEHNISENGYNGERDDSTSLSGEIADATSVAPQKNVLDDLLRLGPDMAKERHTDGRLPLHIAIASGKEMKDGVEGLLSAYPESVSLPDIKTGLVPFMLAAVVNNASRNISSHLGLVYDLLRRNPALVRPGIVENDVEQKSRSVVDYFHVHDLRAALEEVPTRLLRPHGALQEVRITDENPVHNLNRERLAPGLYPEMDWVTENLDAKSSRAQSVDGELHRLQVLKSYSILDTDPDEALERVTRLAAEMFDAPICLVSLVDLGRQWFKSNRGLGDTRETPRKLAFCAHVIQSNKDIFIVRDTLRDDRFVKNQLVNGPPYIRFYAGVPLICPQSGQRLGTLCVIDRKPRPQGLTSVEMQSLRDFASMAMDHLVSLKDEIARADNKDVTSSTYLAHDLLMPLSRVERCMLLLSKDARIRSALQGELRDIFFSGMSCCGIAEQICRGALGESISVGENVEEKESYAGPGCEMSLTCLIQRLRHTLNVCGMNIPVSFQVDHDVPLVIISDESKLFRSATNYLFMVCQIKDVGSVLLRICVEGKMLTFEFEGNRYDETLTTEVLSVSTKNHGRQNIKSLDVPLFYRDLAWRSVAQNIESLGGKYGFPRSERSWRFKSKDDSSDGDHLGLSLGSTIACPKTFWFSVPLVLPTARKFNGGNDDGQERTALENASITFSREGKTNDSIGVQVGSVNKKRSFAQVLQSPTQLEKDEGQITNSQLMHSPFPFSLCKESEKTDCGSVCASDVSKDEKRTALLSEIRAARLKVIEMEGKLTELSRGLD